MSAETTRWPQGLASGALLRAGAALLAALGGLTLLWTRWRGSVQLPPGAVLCLWHRDLLCGAVLAWGEARRGRPVAVLVSRSRDGEFAARALAWWGVPTVRGSSSAAGVLAAKQAIRALRGGTSLLVLPDGPRGPAGHGGAGAARLAGLAGVPLVALRCHLDGAWRLGTWDRTRIPKPGAELAWRVAEVQGERELRDALGPPSDEAPIHRPRPASAAS